LLLLLPVVQICLAKERGRVIDWVYHKRFRGVSLDLVKAAVLANNGVDLPLQVGQCLVELYMCNRHLKSTPQDPYFQMKNPARMCDIRSSAIFFDDS